MKLARDITTAATLALVLSATAACGQGGGSTGPAEPVSTDEDITLTFTWWGNDDRAERYQESIDLFEEEYPNITIQTQFQSWNDYWSARSTEAAGSALPDVMQMDAGYVRQYGATGQLAELDGQIGVNLDVDGVDDSALASGRIEGTTYAVPVSLNTQSLIYNTKLLDELGMEPPAEGYDWDDLIAWFSDVAEAGADHDPRVYPIGDMTGNSPWFQQWLVQQGKAPFTDDGEITFTEEDVRAWADLWAPLREAEAFFPAQRAAQLEPKTGINSSEVVAEANWDTLMPNYTAELGSDDLDLMPIPTGDDGQKMYWHAGVMLSASASSAHPDAAAAFIDFMTNDPRVGKIFGTSKGVPATQAQRDAMTVKEGSPDDRLLTYEDAMSDEITEPAPVPVEGYGQIELEMSRLAEEMEYGNISDDEFVDQWFAYAQDTVQAD
ncbi:ABC transporter substrate-binding protein [Isoptericola sp. BMS4]|uniref:ABC transporter substrate-binding protein n=1 Tax=Isoptericola sp. BMS4 TaxID=2527875 RepID=UPI00142227E0|nr:extracellular solute-binding protein [Isoptericola sp. BMS4]